VAAHDRGEEDSGLHKCRGCIWYYHDYLRELTGVSKSYRNWQLAFRDPYPLLVAFGVILFVCWAITGAIGAVAKTASIAKIVSDVLLHRYST
jgi:hypothetical protein